MDDDDDDDEEEDVEPTPAPARKRGAPTSASPAATRSKKPKGGAPPAAKSPAAPAAGAAGWTAAQEKALRTAATKFSDQTPSRWEKVAATVGGKTKDACKKHWKEMNK